MWGYGQVQDLGSGGTAKGEASTSVFRAQRAAQGTRGSGGLGRPPWVIRSKPCSPGTGVAETTRAPGKDGPRDGLGLRRTPNSRHLGAPWHSPVLRWLWAPPMPQGRSSAVEATPGRSARVSAALPGPAHPQEVAPLASSVVPGRGAALCGAWSPATQKSALTGGVQRSLGTTLVWLKVHLSFTRPECVTSEALGEPRFLLRCCHRRRRP